MPTRACNACGKEYTYERSTSEYCSAQCRGRKHKNERYRIPDDLRMHVLSRDEYRCRLCGSAPDESRELRIDHVVPVHAGGLPLDPDNLQTLCHSCNSGKSDGDAVTGWHVLTCVVDGQTLQVQFRQVGGDEHPARLYSDDLLYALAEGEVTE